jgi:hypothetical protein
MNDEERAHLMPDTEIRLCPAGWRPIGQSGGNLKDIASPALDAHIVRDIPKAIALLPERDDHKRIDPRMCNQWHHRERSRTGRYPHGHDRFDGQ